MKKIDVIWSLSLFGTAVGAGILFLPITAGLGGFWPIVVMALLAFPMTYFAHRGLARFVYSGSEGEDITNVADRDFGAKIGFVVTLLYFIAIFSILLVYAVSLVNTVEAFISVNLGFQTPPKALIAAVLVGVLMFLVNYGEEIVIRAMSVLVFPFVASVMALSLYLIPEWSGGVFLVQEASSWHVISSIFFIIPVMVFSFNHSPIISSMVLAQKRTYGEDAEEHINKILLVGHILIVFVVLFFVFSCVMTFSEEQLLDAKNKNYTILSYMAESFKNPVLHDVAPIIAMIAITKSFLGHYMGTREGFLGLVRRVPQASSVNKKLLDYMTLGFIGVLCFVVAVIDPSVLGMIETLSGPILAIILFIMPSIAVMKIPALKKYTAPSVYFVLIIGVMALLAIVFEVI